MSYPLPEQLKKLPQSDLKQLMQSVVSFQNGDTARTMKRMGINYELNYGVSIPQLRQLANSFVSDHELASELIHQNIREAMILASMIDDPLLISEDEISHYLVQMTNIELVEQFSRNLFSRIPAVIEFVEEWATSFNEWHTVAAFYTLGWVFKFQKEINHELQIFALKMIENYEVKENFHLTKAIGFAMQSLSGYSGELMQKVNVMAERMSNNENTAIRQIGQEFLWLNAK